MDPRVPSYAEVVARLRSAGCVFAENEATILIDAAGPVELDLLVARRIAGEPLEHIVGWADLAGLRILVAPGVFVPRRRTELLARRAAALVTPGATVVDLCCGSGAVGVVVRAVVPAVDLHAADLDPVAVACARRNVGDRVYQGDLYDALPEALRGRVAVVVANAPYVPSDAVALMPAESREFEPRPTVDGGPDGLGVIARIVAGAAEWLTSGGHVLFEIGADQAEAARELCLRASLVAMVLHDDDLAATVVVAQRD
jgi:release factor glutamine methyltransferase